MSINSESSKRLIFQNPSKFTENQRFDTKIRKNVAKSSFRPIRRKKKYEKCEITHRDMQQRDDIEM
jgi:hypothetical protein